MEHGEPNLFPDGKNPADEMLGKHRRNMNAIKQQVDVGAYSVDAQAVADAIVRRILANAARRSGGANGPSVHRDSE